MQTFKNFPLSEILYYKIGGKAQYVLKIENKEDLQEALDFVEKNKIKKILPLGLGSNVLVNDIIFDGAVLWFSSSLKNGIIQKDSGLVEVFSSVLLDNLIKFSFDNSLIGLEWAGGLPSTVGGAIRGNAGAFGGEIAGSIYEVEILELLKEGGVVRKTFKASDLEFAYRDSLVKKHKNWIIGNSYFKLNIADADTLSKAKKIYLSHIDYRNKNHPIDYPSCGSVFKNITKKEDVVNILSLWVDIKDLVEKKWYHKVSMGYVINRLGFSGFRIGGAEVSTKHANYIVNVNHARFNDVINIIEKIKEKFFKTFGFYAEVEVEVVS